jgi:hypothetical protein
MMSKKPTIEEVQRIIDSYFSKNMQKQEKAVNTFTEKEEED